MLSSAKPNAVGSHVDITTIDINAIAMRCFTNDFQQCVYGKDD